MDAIITVEVGAVSQADLNRKAIDRIIEQAARLSRNPRDKNFDVWREIYEPAKKAIAEFDLTAEEYQYAIASLTEAMRV